MSLPPYPYQPPPYDPQGSQGNAVPGQPYPQHYPYPGPYAPRPQPTNAMAIAALVCAFVFAPLGIVFGHISLSQIKRTGEQGRTMAIVSLVIGYLSVVLAILAVALVILLAVVVGSQDSTYGHYDRSHAASYTVVGPR